MYRIDTLDSRIILIVNEYFLNLKLSSYTQNTDNLLKELILFNRLQKGRSSQLYLLYFFMLTIFVGKLI